MAHFWTRPQTTVALRNSGSTALFNSFTSDETNAGGAVMTDHTATITRDLKLIVNLHAARRVLLAQQESLVASSALSNVALSLNPGTCDDITPGQLVRLAESADLFAQEGITVTNTLTAIDQLLSQVDLDIRASISSCGSDAACVFSDFRASAVTDQATLQTRITDVQSFITQIDGYVSLTNQMPVTAPGGTTQPTTPAPQPNPPTAAGNPPTAAGNPPTAAGNPPTTPTPPKPNPFGTYVPTHATMGAPAATGSASEEEVLVASSKGGRHRSK